MNWNIWFPSDHHPEERLVEAWERMTYGGVTARIDDIVPNNFYSNVGGKHVSYPMKGTK